MTENTYPQYIPNQGLNWRGVLKGISKANDSLQPLFEAFTNSLESIELRKKVESNFTPHILIDFFFNANTEGENDGLSKLVVTDNGIGFDDENFRRLQIFKDDSKGFNNRGSGRLQILHSFNYSKYESTYKDNGIIKKRVFILSKRGEYLSNNAILKIEDEVESTTGEIMTRLSMCDLMENIDVKFYNEKSIDDIKEALLDHYIMQFCAYEDHLPAITINYIQYDRVIDTRYITRDDIPTQTVNDQFITVPMCIISNDMKRIEITNDQVSISIKSFKLPSAKIKKNSAKVTCKKELIDSVKVKMACLPPELEINSSRFLFLLSSEYFDNNIGDNRDSFEILNRTDFKKRAKQYGSIIPQIVLDDIEEKVSEKAAEMYAEISQQKEVHQKRLLDLKDTYMLSDEALVDADINDSTEDILSKAYSYDAKLIAKQDAAYQEKMEQLKQLNTTSPTYMEDLETLVTELSRTIPLQCKESLSRYITHRTLVLDLFEKLINKETEIQRTSERRMDEKLIHNLIFRQGDENVAASDMWMLNEDYLYYKGYSESHLNEIVINGKKLFKDIINEEEERYLNSLGEHRLTKRPDILLFPSEHKCVIIELKSLEANISHYLHQITQYASFIRSYTTDDFYIDTFYGYLVGEAMEPNDVRAADNDFKYDPKFNFCYRPTKSIACLSDPSGSRDGVIYTEALSFSVVLERAKKRNESFRVKLFPQLNTQQINDGL